MLNVEDCPHHWAGEGGGAMEEEILLVLVTIKLEIKAGGCAVPKLHLCSNPGTTEGGEGGGCGGAWKEAWVWMGRLEQWIWGLPGDHHPCSSWLILHLCLHEFLQWSYSLNLTLRGIPGEAAVNIFLPQSQYSQPFTFFSICFIRVSCPTVTSLLGFPSPCSGFGSTTIMWQSPPCHPLRDTSSGMSSHSLNTSRGVIICNPTCNHIFCEEIPPDVQP